MRVLFIGNSFTWYNGGQARIGMHLAESAFEKQLSPDERKQFKPAVYEQISGDGWELEQHIEYGKVQKRLAEGHWDYVVLQDHSQETLLYPERFRSSVITLDAMIKKSGAKTVLFMTWAKSNEMQNQGTITQMYQSVGDEIGAIVVPVGKAFEKTVQTTSIGVHDSLDNRHPTAEGSYLTACCFYSLFYARSPIGLGALTIIDGKKSVELDSATAETLQRIAWETTRPLLNDQVEKSAR